VDRGLKARLALAAYLAAVVAATLVHDWRLLAAALALALVLAGPARWRLLRRTLLSVLAFNLAVSVGYAAMAAWQGSFSPDYLLLVNARVLLMVFLGFWFVARTDVLAAVSFSPGASFLVTVAAGQALLLRRRLQDFRLAFASRNLRPAGWPARLKHAAAQGQHLMDRSVNAAEEVAQAMRARGAFDD
jgi:cobalt/nickel transport system permease protein